jgi:putative transposase
MMGSGNFSEEFKRDAVAQITERGYPAAEVSQRPGVSQHSLYAWKKKLSKPSGSERVFRQGRKVKYAFVAEHRQQFTVRAMCRCLRIRPNGFYAWLKNPPSKRAREDLRQTALLSKTWKESDRVYGYRKRHDDLLDRGKTCCPTASCASPCWPW